MAENKMLVVGGGFSGLTTAVEAAEAGTESGGISILPGTTLERGLPQCDPVVARNSDEGLRGRPQHGGEPGFHLSRKGNEIFPSSLIHRNEAS